MRSFPVGMTLKQWRDMKCYFCSTTLRAQMAWSLVGDLCGTSAAVFWCGWWLGKGLKLHLELILKWFLDVFGVQGFHAYSRTRLERTASTPFLASSGLKVSANVKFKGNHERQLMAFTLNTCITRGYLVISHRILLMYCCVLAPSCFLAGVREVCSWCILSSTYSPAIWSIRILCCRSCRPFLRSCWWALVKVLLLLHPTIAAPICKERSPRLPFLTFPGTCSPLFLQRAAVIPFFVCVFSDSHALCIFTRWRWSEHHDSFCVVFSLPAGQSMPRMSKHLIEFVFDMSSFCFGSRSTTKAWQLIPRSWQWHGRSESQ